MVISLESIKGFPTWLNWLFNNRTVRGFTFFPRLTSLTKFVNESHDLEKFDMDLFTAEMLSRTAFSHINDDCKAARLLNAR